MVPIHQTLKRGRAPVRPSAATPASKRTRCPGTLWTSWKTSRNPAGRSTSSLEPSSWTCPARRSVVLCAIIIIFMMIIQLWNVFVIFGSSVCRNDQTNKLISFYDVLDRISVLKNFQSAFRISTRAWPTGWWAILKVCSERLWTFMSWCYWWLHVKSGIEYQVKWVTQARDVTVHNSH